MAKSAFTPEQRAMISQRYLDGEAASSLAAEYGISKRTIYLWAQRFESQSIAAFDRGMATHHMRLS